MLLKYGTTQSSSVLIQMGANFPPLFYWEHEWWRLITAAFIHIGAEHIVFNSITLFYLGSDIEQILGHTRFILIYLFAAIGGNLASVALNMSVSAGASTALFGLFASYVILGKLNPNIPLLRARSMTYTILIIFQLVNGLMSQGVDNWGHIGGLIYGGLMTLIIGPTTRSDYRNKQRAIGILISIILSICLYYFGYIKFAL